MQISTDSTVLYGLIQDELDKRWPQIIDNSQSLPFVEMPVVPVSSIPRILFRDFALNIVNQLKAQQ